MSLQDDDRIDVTQIDDIGAELERSLTNEWDAKIITYPIDRFPFSEWIRHRISKLGYPVTDLSYFHEVVPQAETNRISRQLSADTNLPEFRQMLNAFVREVVVPKGKLRKPLAVQRFMNVRIMLPTTPELYFPLHTGLLYGHGIASRSLWLPFVDVTADEDITRSMQIVPIKKSRELTQYAIQNRLSIAEMTKIWGEFAHQIKAGPGSCCLFSQENIHGSGMPNITGKTRISMDFRIAEAVYGDRLGRKTSPGYFQLIPDTEEEEEKISQLPARQVELQNGKQNIFYVANNTSSTFAVLIHLQRHVMLDYVKKKDISFDYELTDLSDMPHCPTLTHLIEERNANIVMFSIFALPENESDRDYVCETALKRGNIVHFANEDLQLVTAEDLVTIRSYLAFSKYGHSRMPIGLPLSDATKDYFEKWAKMTAKAGS